MWKIFEIGHETSNNINEVKKNFKRLDFFNASVFHVVWNNVISYHKMSKKYILFSKVCSIPVSSVGKRGVIGIAEVRGGPVVSGVVEGLGFGFSTAL